MAMEPAERTYKSKRTSLSRNKLSTNTQQKSVVTRRFVLLLGLSGTGKTKFARDVAEGPFFPTNPYPQSDFGDSPVYTYKSKSKHNELELVEPPAFDISPSGDWQQAVQSLCQWVTQMPTGCEIGGILYFHRISDDRMSGSSKRALRLLNALCGDSYMPNVRLVTTHWDLIPKDIGESREAELMADYWADMIALKAKVMRYQDLRDGKQIFNSLGRGGGRQTARRPAIQQELKDGKLWDQTAAGDILRSENEKALRRRQQELIQTMEELVELSKIVTGHREKEEIQKNLSFFEEQLCKLIVPISSASETGGGLESDPIEGSSGLRQSGAEGKTPEEMEFEFHGPKREQTTLGNLGFLVQRLKIRTRQNVSDPKQERKFWESLKTLVSDMVKAFNPITGASRLARASTTRFTTPGTHPSSNANPTSSPNQESGTYGLQNAGSSAT